MALPISTAYSIPTPAVSNSTVDFTCINPVAANFQTIVLSMLVPLVNGKRSLDFEIRGIGNAFIIRNISFNQAGAVLKFFDSNARTSEYIRLS